MRYRCDACGVDGFRTKREVLEHSFTAHVTVLPVILHGEDRGYYAHRRHGVPFPEDVGGKPCGCRQAHSQAVNAWGRAWRRGYGFKHPAFRDRS